MQSGPHPLPVSGSGTHAHMSTSSSVTLLGSRCVKMLRWILCQMFFNAFASGSPNLSTSAAFCLASCAARRMSISSLSISWGASQLENFGSLFREQNLRGRRGRRDRARSEVSYWRPARARSPDRLVAISDEPERNALPSGGSLPGSNGSRRAIGGRRHRGEKPFGSFKVEAAGAVDAPLVVVAETFGDVVGDPSPHLAGVALHPRVGGQRLQQRLKRRRVGGHDEAKSAACRLLRFSADAQRSSIRP